jgi:hypothetical protein
LKESSVAERIENLFNPDHEIVVPETETVYTQQWIDALLAKDFLGSPIFAARLSPKDDLDKGILVLVSYLSGSSDPRVEIPVRDDTPKDVLINDFYQNATFFGALDPEKFEALATREDRVDTLVAYLNGRRQGANDVSTDLLGDVLGLEHREGYGDVHVGYFGYSLDSGGYKCKYTIEESNRRSWDDNVAPDVFAGMVNRSLPHLVLEPLSRDDYISAVAQNLPFLPEDWDIS